MEPGHGFRKLVWKKARARVIGKAMPLEVVRQRVRRAAALGLSYPDYAAIVFGSGRDIAAFLFTTESMGLRLLKRLEMSDPVQQRLSDLPGCTRLAIAPAGEPVEPFRLELEDVSRLSFPGAGPTPGAGWKAAETAMRRALQSTRLPADSVVLVGTEAKEASWAEAGRLAKYLAHDRFFHAPG